MLKSPILSLTQKNLNQAGDRWLVHFMIFGPAGTLPEKPGVGQRVASGQPENGKTKDHFRRRSAEIAIAINLK
jgi:hypothetical protein